MTGHAEAAVLDLLLQIRFPGIRHGEGNSTVCDSLRGRGYFFTPDLVAGPDDLDQAPIEGLFFVDVIEPTPDLLFKSSASHNLPVNVSTTFKKILDDSSNEKELPTINALPIEHHQCYVDALNKKLDKYSHRRTFTRDGKTVKSANLGIVHHFDLGRISGNNVENVCSLMTFLDYVRFYKRLAPSVNTDLKVASNRLLRELFNQEQRFPHIMMVFREWQDVPYLFLMLHVRVMKNGGASDLGIIVVNTTILDCGLTHPVYQWVRHYIQKNSPEVVTEKECADHIPTIRFNKDGSHFS